MQHVFGGLREGLPTYGRMRGGCRHQLHQNHAFAANDLQSWYVFNREEKRWFYNTWGVFAGFVAANMLDNDLMPAV